MDRRANVTCRSPSMNATSRKCATGSPIRHRITCTLCAALTATSICQHGLTRNIPAAIKRGVRKNSGFSYVICSNPFCTYEHITQEIKTATEHNSDHICLQCRTCHGEITVGRHPKDFDQKNIRKVENMGSMKVRN